MSEDIRNLLNSGEDSELNNQDVDYTGGNTGTQSIRDLINTAEDPTYTKEQLEAEKQALLNFETRNPALKFGEEMASMRDYLGENFNAEIQDLEDMRSWAQGGWGLLAKGIGRAAGKAVTSIGETAGILGGFMGETAEAISGIAQGKEGEEYDFNLTGAINNSFTDLMQDLDESIKESMPVYTRKSIENGTLMDNLLDGTFWATEGADGVGFLVGAMAPGAAIKALGIGSKMAIGLNALGGHHKWGKLVNVAAKLAEKGDLALATAINTVGEAGIEAGAVGRELEEYYTKMVETGQMSEEKAKESIANTMASVFGANALLLVGPNLFMNSVLFKAISPESGVGPNLTKKILGEEIGTMPKFFEKAKPFIETGKGAMWEGFAEEGGQFAIENYFKDRAKRGEGPEGKQGVMGTLSDLVSSSGSLVDEYIKGFSTLEGKKSMALGAILGMGGTAYSEYRQTKAKKAAENTLLGIIEKNREGLEEGIKSLLKTDPTTGEPVTTEGGRPMMDPAKIMEAIEKAENTKDAAVALEAARLSGNKEAEEFALNELITKYVEPFAEIDGGIDALEEAIEPMLEGIIKNAGENPNFNKQAFKDKMIAKAKEVAKQKDYMNLYGNNFFKITIPDTQDKITRDRYESARASFLKKLQKAGVYNATRQSHVQERIEELNKQKAEIYSKEGKTEGEKLSKGASEIVKNINKQVETYNNSLVSLDKEAEEIFNKSAQQEAFNEYLKSRYDLDALLEKIKKDAETDPSTFGEGSEEELEYISNVYKNNTDIEEIVIDGKPRKVLHSAEFSIKAEGLDLAEGDNTFVIKNKNSQGNLTVKNTKTGAEGFLNKDGSFSFMKNEYKNVSLNTKRKAEDVRKERQKNSFLGYYDEQIAIAKNQINAFDKAINKYKNNINYITKQLDKALTNALKSKTNKGGRVWTQINGKKVLLDTVQLEDRLNRLEALITEQEANKQEFTDKLKALENKKLSLIRENMLDIKNALNLDYVKGEINETEKLIENNDKIIEDTKSFIEAGRKYIKKLNAMLKGLFTSFKKLFIEVYPEYAGEEIDEVDFQDGYLRIKDRSVNNNPEFETIFGNTESVVGKIELKESEVIALQNDLVKLEEEQERLNKSLALRQKYLNEFYNRYIKFLKANKLLISEETEIDGKVKDVSEEFTTEATDKEAKELDKKGPIASTGELYDAAGTVATKFFGLESFFKTQSSQDTKDPVAKRWFKWLEGYIVSPKTNTKLVAYSVHTLPKELHDKVEFFIPNNPADPSEGGRTLLRSEIEDTDAETLALAEQDIKLVAYNSKDRVPVLDGKMPIYSSLPLPNYTMPSGNQRFSFDHLAVNMIKNYVSKIKDYKSLSEAEQNKIKADAKEYAIKKIEELKDKAVKEYAAFRENALTTPISFSVIGKNPGVKVDTISGSPVGRVTKNKEDLKYTTVQIAVNNSLTHNGMEYSVMPGQAYVEHQGRLILLERKTLSETDDIDRVIRLLTHYASLTDKTAKEELHAYLKTILYFNKNISQAKFVFVKKGEELHFGDQIITKKELIEQNEEKLEALATFLSSKHHNIESTFIKGNTPYEVKDVVKGELKTIETYKNGYKTYILSSKTDVNLAPLGKPEAPQFLNPSLQLETVKATPATKEAKEEVKKVVATPVTTAGPVTTAKATPEEYLKAFNDGKVVSITRPTKDGTIETVLFKKEGESIEFVTRYVDGEEFTSNKATFEAIKKRLEDKETIITMEDMVESVAKEKWAGITEFGVESAPVIKAAPVTPSTTVSTDEKADIKRRWQEELDNIGKKGIKITFPQVVSFISSMGTSFDVGTKADTGISTVEYTGKVTEEGTISKLKAKSFKEAEGKILPKGYHFIVPGTAITLTLTESKLKAAINTKYEAELAALEGPELTPLEKIAAMGVGSESSLASAMGLTESDFEGLTDTTVESAPKEEEETTTDEDTTSYYDLSDEIDLDSTFNKLLGVQNKEELNKTIKWFKNKFPDIDIEVVKELIDEYSEGRLTSAGKVLISEISSLGVTYHEAFHVVSRMFLTPEQRSSLYKEVEKITGTKMTEREAEEYLAEEFRSFMLSDGKYNFPKGTEEAKGLFNKIWNFLKSFFNNIIGKKNEASISIEKVFRDIASDKVYTGKGTAIREDWDSRILNYNHSTSYDLVKHFNYTFFRTILNPKFKGAHPKAGAELLMNFDENLVDIYAHIKNNVLSEEDPNNPGTRRIKETGAVRTMNAFMYKNFDVLIQEHAKFLKQYQIAVDEESILPEEERGKDSNNYQSANKSSVKDLLPSPIKLLIAGLPAVNEDLKLKQKEVEVKDSKGKKLGGKFVTVEAINYGKTISLLNNMLSNTISYNEMVNKLMEGSDKHPEYKYLLTYLGSKPGVEVKEGATADQLALQTLFYRYFSKSKNSPLIAMIQESGEMSFADALDVSLRTTVLDQWKNNVKFNYKSSFFTQKNGRLLLNPELQIKVSGERVFTINSLTPSLLTKFTKDDKVKFLSKFGIDISSLKGEENTAVINETSSWLLKQVKDLLAVGLDIDPDDIFNKSTLDINSKINNLADAVANTLDDDTELQWFDQDGKRRYAVTLNTHLSKMVSAINNLFGLDSKDDTSINKAGKLAPYSQDNKTGNIYTINSKWLKKVKETNLRVVTLQGVKDLADRKGSETAMLDKHTLRFMHTNAVLKGYFPLLRSADRATEYAFAFGEREALKDFNSVLFLEQMMGYLQDELTGTSALMTDGIGSNLAFYSERALSLRFFKDIIPSEIVTSFKAYVTTNGEKGQDLTKLAKEFINENRRELSSAISDWLDKEAKINIALWEESGIITKAGKDNYIAVGIDDSIIKDAFPGQEKEKTKDGEIILSKRDINILASRFTAKYTEGTIEQTKLFTGDIAHFKNEGDFHKRVNGTSSTKEDVRTGTAYNEALNKVYKRADGKAMSDTFNKVITKDVKVRSKYYDRYKEVLMSAFGKEGAKLADNYTEKKIEEADGQGRLTLDAYRELKIKGEEWNNEDERTYQYEMQLLFKRIYKMEMNSKKVDQKAIDNLSARFTNLFEEHVGETTLSEFTKPMFKGTVIDHVNKPLKPLPVLKPQGFGTINNVDNLYATDFSKLSVAPIIPSTLKANSPMFWHLLDMMENQIDIEVIASGSKADKFKNIPNYYNTDGSLYKVSTDYIQEMNLADFGLQQKMEAKIKTKATLSTQKESLEFVDLFENGQVISRITNPERRKYINDLKDKKVEIKSALVKLNRESLIKRLGLTETKDGNFRLKDSIDKFKSTVKDAFLQRNMTENAMEGLDLALDSKGQLLDTIANKKEIESVLMSLVRNNVIKQKVNGGMYAQESSTGLEYEYRKGDIKNSNHLEFYREDETGKILSAEIELPLPKEWIKWVESMGGLDVFNEKIANGEISDDILEIAANRTPGQGLNSIESLRIKRFLPYHVGAKVVVPTELVIKTGSDFDIDKLTIYLPNITFDKTGNPVYERVSLEESEAATNQRYLKRVLEEFKDLLHREQVLDPETDEQLTSFDKYINKYDKKYKGYIDESPIIVKIKEEYKSIVAKNGNKTNANLKDIYQEKLNIARELIHNKFLENNIYDGHIKYMATKLATDFKLTTLEEFNKLPIMEQQSKKALENSIMEVTKKVVTLPENFPFLIKPLDTTVLKDLAGNPISSPSTTDLLRWEYNLEVGENNWAGLLGVGMTAVNHTSHAYTQQSPVAVANPTVELFFKSQDRSKGVYYMGHTTDQSGTYISANFNEFLSAFVDVAKDPFIKRLNAGEDILNAYMALHRISNTKPLSMDTLVGFFTQPVILKYLDAMSKNNALFNKNREYKKDIISKVLAEFGATAPKVLLSDAYDDYLINGDLEAYNKVKAGLNYRLIDDKEIKTIPSDKSKSGIKKQTLSNKKDIVQILDTFLLYQKYGQSLGTFNKVIKVDTDLASTRAYHRTVERLYNKVLEDAFFDPNDVENLLNNTILKEYKVTRTMSRRLFSQFFITDRLSQYFDDIFDKVLSIYEDPSKIVKGRGKVLDKVSNKLESHIINYILHTGKDSTGKSLNQQYKDLISSTGKKSVAKRTPDIKKIVGDNLILDNLVPMLDEFVARRNKNLGIDNIKLYNKKFTTEEQNANVAAFIDLLEHDNETVREYAKDLVKLSIIQSGIDQSPIAYSKMLPNAFFQPFTEELISSFIKADKLSIGAITNTFFMNNWLDPDIVPVQNDVWVTDIITGFKRPIQMFDKDGNLLVTLKDDNSKYPFLVYKQPLESDKYKKVTGYKAKEEYLFRRVKDVVVNGKQVFEPISKLGYGDRFTEIPAEGSGSILDGNNKKLDKRKTISEDELFSLEATQEVLSDETYDALKTFLKSINVDLKEVEAILDRNGNKVVDANGVARLTLKTIDIIKGKEGLKALPEEAAHFYVSLLGRDSGLYQSMYKSIKEYGFYSEVYDQYAERYEGDERLLREEAIGKLIAAHIQSITTGQPMPANMVLTERQQKQVETWWKAIWAKISKLLSKWVSDPYAEAALDILSNNISKLETTEVKVSPIQPIVGTEAHTRLKIVDALLKMAAPKETKRSRKYGEETEAERTTIRLGTKDRPHLEENLRTSLLKKGVPTDQVNYMIDYMKANDISEIATEELAMRLAEDLSYTVEVNRGMERKGGYTKEITDPDRLPSSIEDKTKGYKYVYNLGKDNYEIQNLYGSFIGSITKEEALEVYKGLMENATPSEYYSHISVPGGINYSEHEIATPAITPVLKGHAQFSTPQGIGWFRSDDLYTDIYNRARTEQKIKEMDERDLPTKFNVMHDTITVYYRKTDKGWESKGVEYEGAEFEDLIHDWRPVKLSEVKEEWLYTYSYDTLHEDTKPTTRRVLELQSDLFQKKKDKNILTEPAFNIIKEGDTITGKKGFTYKVISKNISNITLDVNGKEQKAGAEFINENITAINGKPITNTKNDFLKMLSKDGRWVKFFIKNIMQDSAKKGYTKVRFPKGETAAKIEGHDILANRIVEWKKQLEEINEKLANEEALVKEAKDSLEFNYHIYEATRPTYNIHPLDNNRGYQVIINTEGEYDIWDVYNTKEEAENVVAIMRAEDQAKIDKFKLKGITEKEVAEQLEYTKKELKAQKENLEDSILQYKTQGIEKLAPIEGFYENRVGNILKKEYKNIKTITDEHGNQWLEVEVEYARDLSPIMFSLTNKTKKQVKEELGIANMKQGITGLLLAKAKKRLDNYNTKNNTSHRMPSREVGANVWNWELELSFSPANPFNKEQRALNRKDPDKQLNLFEPVRNIVRGMKENPIDKTETISNNKYEMAKVRLNKERVAEIRRNFTGFEAFTDEEVLFAMEQMDNGNYEVECNI